jgi:Carboxypeptidase regulatory-like domain
MTNVAMRKAETGLFTFLADLVLAGSVLAQTPTGSIAGVVTDPSGLPVAARLRVLDRANGLSRSLTASVEGNFSAAALPSGIYQVTAEASGFHLLERTVTVEAGTTTGVDLVLELGEVTEKVTIDDAVPLIHYDHHQLGGLVSRVEIENLPLNGRNFLELVKLEAGVTNPIRASNNRTIVPTLGAVSQGSPRIGYTRASVDGVSIMAITAPGAALNVSQDVVQESKSLPSTWIFRPA